MNERRMTQISDGPMMSTVGRGRYCVMKMERGRHYKLYMSLTTTNTVRIMDLLEPVEQK